MCSPDLPRNNENHLETIVVAVAFVLERFSEAPVLRKETIILNAARDHLNYFFFVGKGLYYRRAAVDDIYKGYYYFVLLASSFPPFSHKFFYK